MKKIRFKFSWLSSLTALLWLIIIAAVAVIWNQTGASEARYLKELDRSLEHIVRSKLPELRSALTSGNLAEVRDLCAGRNNSEVRFTLIDEQGGVLADSRARYDRMDNHLSRPEVAEVLGGEPISSQVRFSGTANTPSLYCALPLEVNGTRYVLRGSLSMSELESVMRRARQNLLLVGIAVATVLSFLSFYVVHKVIFPLRRLRMTAGRIAAGEFDLPLPTSSPGEVGRLALPLGRLAEQLKERYDEVNRQKQERDMVFNALGEGLVVLSMNHTVIEYNPAAAKMFQFSGEVRKLPFRALVRSMRLHEFIDKISQTGEPGEIELSLEREVEPRYVRVCAVRMDAAAQIPYGIVLVFTDITRIRRLENFRRDFIANVSHEIKTPLTVIQGAAETLLDGAMEDPDSAAHFLKVIEKHCCRLNLLVQDILSISNLEEKTTQGQDRSEFIRLNLAEVIHNAVDLCRARLLPDQQLLEDLSTGPLWVMGDSATLEQAVLNLVDNAIKYAGENVHISVGLKRDGNEAVISIADNGCGIPQEHLARLFERFYRVDKARSRKAGGTGLGLSIVKHIIQWHQGQTEVSSRVNYGTTFRIRLPLAPAEK